MVKWKWNINEILIDHGEDINKINEYGEIPLFIACERGNEAIVKYLIKFGAYINTKICDDETPLFKACLNGNVVLVKYLVELGVDMIN